MKNPEFPYFIFINAYVFIFVYVFIYVYVNTHRWKTLNSHILFLLMHMYSYVCEYQGISRCEILKEHEWWVFQIIWIIYMDIEIAVGVYLRIFIHYVCMYTGEERGGRGTYERTSIQL
jgi:hypothetical protein